MITLNIFLKGKTFQQANDDFHNDMNVNADGRRMALNGNYNSAFEACDKYRPAGYDPLDRFKYYKKIICIVLFYKTFILKRIG